MPFEKVPFSAPVRVGDFKLWEFFENGRLELYNLRDDVGQKSDPARSMPEKAAELHAKLVAWREAIHAPMPTKRTVSATGDEPAKPAKEKKKRKQTKSGVANE